MMLCKIVCNAHTRVLYLAHPNKHLIMLILICCGLTLDCLIILLFYMLPAPNMNTHLVLNPKAWLL